MMFGLGRPFTGSLFVFTVKLVNIIYWIDTLKKREKEREHGSMDYIVLNNVLSSITDFYF
jgi:hypothetical protein